MIPTDLGLPPKLCTKCGESKPRTEFHKKGHGLRSECRSCTSKSKRRWWANLPVARRLTLRKAESNRKTASRYGLTQDEYTAKLNKPCEICENKLDVRGGHGMHLDHDHATDAIRGTLCHKCNKGLGVFQDSPELLERAAAYLRSYR